jgi:hypothetical protein
MEKIINTDLIAHSEHIIDDVYSTFDNIDDATAQKIVEFTQAYIKAAVEIALESPEWFE